MSNDQWDKDQRAAGWDNKQGESQWQPSSGAWEQGGDTSAKQHWDQPSQEPQQPPAQRPKGAWPVEQEQHPHQDNQPQPSAQDWKTGAQQQHSANEQHSAREWTTGGQQQASASEWHGDGQQWNVPGQPSGGQSRPGRNQNPQSSFAPGQQYQQQPAKEPTGLGNLFDLSFKRFVLPRGAGIMFMIIAIGLLVHWLFNLVLVLSYGVGFFGVLDEVFGKLALAFVYILLTRAFLEGMSALVSMSSKNKDHDKS